MSPTGRRPRGRPRTRWRDYVSQLAWERHRESPLGRTGGSVWAMQFFYIEFSVSPFKWTFLRGCSARESNFKLNVSSLHLLTRWKKSLLLGINEPLLNWYCGAFPPIIHDPAVKQKGSGRDR
ncbi:hypothetical protein L3Q82_010863 [Scortum barcoo]|uniref:Uncharacterized protein n=1 Tax=Scortum barcoo TaxID=214431 RepID=A0ACB8W995_9TELE|nr:hypothetical protein L3Q82_010863 [Scortum barcoo]